MLSNYCLIEFLFVSAEYRTWSTNCEPKAQTLSQPGLRTRLNSTVFAELELELEKIYIFELELEFKKRNFLNLNSKKNKKQLSSSSLIECYNFID